MIPTRLSTTLTGHGGAVHAALFSTDGKYVMTCSADRSIKLYNPQTNTLIKTYTGHGKEVLSIKLPKDNSKFISASGDRSVFLWDVNTGRTIQKFTGHTHRVNSVDLNEDCSVIISGGYDSTVRIWDARATQRKCIQVLSEAKDSIESVKLYANEIITASVDGFSRIYDIRTGKITEDNIQSPCSSSMLSNDMNCILVSSLDDSIRLFDKDTGELLSEYKGHMNKEYRSIPSFTRSDSHVIAGSEDGKIYIWDLVEGKTAKVLEGHSGVITSIIYHPTLDAFVSTSFDATVKLWVV
jgi:mitogen-activated protein kinase organizer 1